MTFLTLQVRKGLQLLLGVLFVLSLMLTANVWAAPAPAYAAEGRPAIMRSDRRIGRERSVRSIQGDHTTDQHRSVRSSSRRPRAVRH